ncbi:amino acid transporter AVT1E-like [Cimex lectularius]|uniref:Amino acid transporter transmembrane domain-containing protein n=1 Tax=Cimex lectularius TaxID=79782 RepID=A0A8I6TCR7_CIMLE|nr:amino acid transporter AVT1E-like [Cimex lectularius]
MFLSEWCNSNNRLSLFFTICCIIDLFGVFPVIALPRAIIECGWLGMPLAFFVFFIQIYTAIMLGRCWIIAENLQFGILEKNRYPYSAVVELAYGKMCSKYVNLILRLAVFGGSIPNLIVAAQNFHLIGLKVSSYQLDFSYCYWIIILGVILCPFMWLGSPKDLKWLAAISVGFVLLSSFLTWFCLLNGKTPSNPFIPNPTWESAAIAYGILSFQFDIHPTILTIQVDMKNRNQLGKAIIIAFIASGSLFLITTIICYVCYGNAVRYNTLQGLEPSESLYANFIVVTVQISLSMVVGVTPLFQDLEEKANIPVGFGWRRCFLRSGVVLGAVFLAEIVPRFDLIMGLIGGALMGQLMFVFPPLLYARLRSLQAQFKARLLPRYFPIGYGSIREIATDRAWIVGNHARVDLSMEDHLDKPHLFQRRTEQDRNSILPFVDLQGEQVSIVEKISNVLLIIFGVLATLLSTYYTLKGTIEYADFTPSCITNVTLASQLIYKFA